jgi:8-oxo-dGTP pyrophosphatase MutT (NUDIX family)
MAEARERVMPGRDDRAPTPASVLVPLVLRPTGLTVLLTQRTAHLTDHAGQISFPGGRAEDYDQTPSTPRCANRKRKSAWRAGTSTCWARCRII